MKQVLVNMDDELKEELKECSENSNISMSQLVRMAIKELLRQYKGEGITVKD